VKINEIAVQLKQPSKLALVLAVPTQEDRPPNPHHMFQVASMDGAMVWYLSGATGPQFNIFEPCLNLTSLNLASMRTST
jgi:hypothetical protein